MFLRLQIILYHIIMFTVPGIFGYPYQQIAVNSTSMFVTVVLVTLRMVSQECWGLAYSVLDTVRYFVWMSF